MVKYGGFWRATPDFVYRLTTMVSGFTYIPSFEVPDRGDPGPGLY